MTEFAVSVALTPAAWDDLTAGLLTLRPGDGAEVRREPGRLVVTGPPGCDPARRIAAEVAEALTASLLPSVGGYVDQSSEDGAMLLVIQLRDDGDPLLVEPVIRQAIEAGAASTLADARRIHALGPARFDGTDLPQSVSLDSDDWGFLLAVAAEDVDARAAVLAGLRAEVQEVLHGETADGGRWAVEVSVNRWGGRAMFCVYDRDGVRLLGGGGGLGLEDGQTMSLSHGHGGEPEHGYVLAELPEPIDRVQVVTARGSEAELPVSGYYPRFGARFAAGLLAPDELPADIRAFTADVLVESRTISLPRRRIRHEGMIVYGRSSTDQDAPDG